MPNSYPYKRILLKLSGELLMGDQKFGIDQQACDKVAKALIKLQQANLEVNGAGSFDPSIYSSMKG